MVKHLPFSDLEYRSESSRTSIFVHCSLALHNIQEFHAWSNVYHIFIVEEPLLLSEAYLIIIFCYYADLSFSGSSIIVITIILQWYIAIQHNPNVRYKTMTIGVAEATVVLVSLGKFHLHHIHNTCSKIHGDSEQTVR